MAVDAELLAQIAYVARFPDTGTRYGEMPWDRLPEDAKNKWRRVATAIEEKAMGEYERLVQDRRDADRARNNDWQARAIKAEAERDMLVAGIKNNIERQRALAAEAILREIVRRGGTWPPPSAAELIEIASAHLEATL